MINIDSNTRTTNTFNLTKNNINDSNKSAIVGKDSLIFLYSDSVL